MDPRLAGWLTNSLEYHERMLRQQGLRARYAYHKEPMASMTKELAETFDAAADVFLVALKRAKERKL